MKTYSAKDTTFIYIMDKADGPYYRVGISDWPEHYKYFIQECNPYKVTVIHTIRIPKKARYEVTAKTKAYLKAFLLRYRWYELEDAVLKGFLSYCEKLQEEAFIKYPQN